MTATLQLRIGHETTALRSPFTPLTAPQRRVLQGLKNVALFLAAPFIGLAFIVLMPFAGLVTLATVAIGQPAPRQ